MSPILKNYDNSLSLLLTDIMSHVFIQLSHLCVLMSPDKIYVVKCSVNTKMATKTTRVYKMCATALGS